MMDLRSLDAEGIDRFRRLLAELRGSEDPNHRWEELRFEFRSLADSSFARAVRCPARVDSGKRFASRYECGRYLVNVLSPCQRAVVDGDDGLWTWLALLWVDQLLPRRGGIVDRPPADENFIAGGVQGKRRVWRTWHRHAIRTSYLLVREHGELVDFVLSGPMNSRGEMVEQLTGRADFLTCPAIIRAAAMLYRNPATGKPKRGATGNDPSRGPVRRFAALMRQYMVNWDLHSMSPEKIIEMLPQEFSDFIG